MPEGESDFGSPVICAAVECGCSLGLRVVSLLVKSKLDMVERNLNWRAARMFGC
jgi:hypothetical protein